MDGLRVIRRRVEGKKPLQLTASTKRGRALLMANSAELAIKMCPLEKRALELITEAAPSGNQFLAYNDATSALVKLRIDRKTALKLLSLFTEKGLLEASCGHGIRLKEKWRKSPNE